MYIGGRADGGRDRELVDKYVKFTEDGEEHKGKRTRGRIEAR